MCLRDGGGGWCLRNFFVLFAQSTKSVCALHAYNFGLIFQKMHSFGCFLNILAVSEHYVTILLKIPLYASKKQKNTI